MTERGLLLSLMRTYRTDGLSVKEAAQKARAELKRRDLVRLLAETDREIAEATAMVEAANMPVPEWVQANVAIRDLGQTRAQFKEKLRRE